MTPNEVVPIATALSAGAAWVALVISVYNAYTQRKNRFPVLRVTMDSRVGTTGMEIYSCRIVNNGSVPAHVRSVRLFVSGSIIDRFGKGRSIPYPETDNSIEQALWENEHRFPTKEEEFSENVLPLTLQPTESVRFATWEPNLRRDLRNARIHYGAFRGRVGVLDQRDKWHTGSAGRSNKGGYQARVSGPIGPGLCRISYMGFAEFPFHALG